MPAFFQTIEALNTPQRQPDRYISICHLLTVVLPLWKRSLPRKFAHILYCRIKLGVPFNHLSVWILKYWSICVVHTRFVFVEKSCFVFHLIQNQNWPLSCLSFVSTWTDSRRRHPARLNWNKGRNGWLVESSELRSCVKVEVAVLGPRP